MRQKRLIAVLFLGLAFATAGFADLAPPKGYSKISVSITLETRDDLADYRLFLVSSDLVKEVFVKKGEKTSVGSLGGGARYSSGKIVAIQRKDLISFGDAPTGDKLAAMEKAIADGTIAGAVTLLNHTFGREVREAEAKTIPDEAFRIERSSTGLNAVPVSNSNSNSNAANSNGGAISTDVKRPVSSLTTILAGILMTLASLSIGLLVFMKFIKKSA